MSKLGEWLRRDLSGPVLRRDFIRGLPFLLVAVALFIDGFLIDGMDGSFRARVIQGGGVIAAALLLAAAILVALRRVLSPRGTKLDIVACVVASLLAFGVTAFYLSVSLWLSEASSQMVPAHSDDPRLERMGKKVLSARDPKVRERGAQLVYEDTGLLLPYRDAQDVVRPYEPTPDDVAKRDERRKAYAEVATTRAMFRTAANQSRWLACADLAVLALVLVPGIIAIGLERRRRDAAAPT